VLNISLHYQEIEFYTLQLLVRAGPTNFFARTKEVLVPHAVGRPVRAVRALSLFSTTKLEKN
jgi:hypothetical protein